METPRSEGRPDFYNQTWPKVAPLGACVLAFGVNEDGQLGLDTVENVETPKVVEALLGTQFCGRVPLVAGSRNTLAIDADGSVLTWGWNARGTLGHGHRGNERKPKRVLGLKGVNVVQIALGGWHCLAVDDSGQCWAWGGNEYGQCGVNLYQRDVVNPTKCLERLHVKKVAAGGMHSLALTDAGEIWMWGEPWGDFSMTIDRTPRRLVETSDFVNIACGAFHNVALNSAGECFTWGINDFGQLGNGTTSYATTPQRVVGLEGVFIVDVAAGGWHSLAISAEGEVFVWGRGEYGRLGLGDRTGSSKLRPLKIKALEGHRVVEGACGGTHTMVVTDEGRCFIWGRGAFGRLGTGLQKDCTSPVELKLPGGPERWRVISVAAGGRHSMVLALPDNSDLQGRQQEWEARKPLLSPPRQASPPASSTGRDRSWPAALADDEQEEGASPLGGVSVDGASVDSASADEAFPDLQDGEMEGPSPETEQQPQSRAASMSTVRSSQQLDAMLEDAARKENFDSSGMGAHGSSPDRAISPGLAQQAAAAARVHGLRDDFPGDRA